MPEDVYWKNYVQRFRTFPALIEAPETESGLIITIPACAEPDLISTLSSLIENHPTESVVEVIILFNKNIFMSFEEVGLHDQIWKNCLQWIDQNKKDWISFLPVYIEEMPDKKGGVGWARKLAMDEAARRSGQDAIIICLDADCIVASNYLTEIDHQFSLHPEFEAASIFFEHNYDPHNIIDDLPIILYELHLRYLVHAQRWCGHPFAFQTVGSAMAVRRNAYLLQGGMNTKRAGEDFYFLQKFIENGKLFEIKNTTVFPSSRVSNRVPFGTGKAMQQILEGKIWMTINFQIFMTIKPLFDSLDKLRDLILEGNSSDALLELHGMRGELFDFLIRDGFWKEVKEIASNTSSLASFKKRFFRYFNAFQMIRYMHFMRDHYYPDVPVEMAVHHLMSTISGQKDKMEKPEQYLESLRASDRTVT
jgi:hypothetical protein